MIAVLPYLASPFISLYAKYSEATRRPSVQYDVPCVYCNVHHVPSEYVQTLHVK